MTHAGEFIFVPIAFHKSHYILYYDPVRNSSKRFEFKEVAEDDFWLNNGDQNGGMFAYHALPNHV